MRTSRCIGVFVIFFCISCKKGNVENNCIYPDIVPFQPYSDPVWHPSGKLLGFNHVPQLRVDTNGVSPCVWYMNAVNFDSSGFYLLNSDGTNFRRVFKYNLTSPAWSPDGKWLAFVLNAQIYKVHFDGYKFDTANIIKLTDVGANFFPAWTPESDTIFYDSNLDNWGETSFYTIWKMDSEGRSKIKVTKSTEGGDSRQPYVGRNGMIYYSSYYKSQPEIFSMKKNGSNPTQMTFNSKNGNRGWAKYKNGILLYNDNGALRRMDKNDDRVLVSPCSTYDISDIGEIIYSKMNFSITDANNQNGTLWIINIDGTQNRQLTINNF